MKLLTEIISDYPRVWEYYKQDTYEKSRGPKFSQRYPLPIATLSMVLDFHKWTHSTVRLVSEQTGLVLENTVRKTAVGPCPAVMYRLSWLNRHWSTLRRKQKRLAVTLGDEILEWHTRIRVKVNDGDNYAYDSTVICQFCEHASVVRMNDMFICVNAECRNPMTGEWRKWQQVSM